MTAASASGRLRRRFSALAAALLLAHALLATPFLEDVGVAFRGQGFAERRVEQAFVGTDMAAVQARLASLIGPGTAVALAPSIEGQELYRQRFREALYPRPVLSAGTPGVEHVLVPNRPGATPARRVVGRLGAYDLILTGALPEPAPPTVAPRAPAGPARALGLGLVAVLAGLGWGLALRRALRGHAHGELDGPSTTALGGLLAVALTGSLATWLQAGLPALATTLLGLLALALLGRGGGLAWRRPSPWVVLPALVLALLGARLCAAPIARWDGRSIWLFHARRLWEHGRFLVAEAADPSTLFSHPDYPLAWPALLAFPSGLAGAFDERLAGLGAALAMAVVLGLGFRLARAALGAPTAAGLLAALGMHVTRATAGGYADGFLALTLLVAFLALRSGRRTLGGVALALAALTKVEGLPLALLVALAGTLAGPTPRLRALRALWPAGLPALAHLAWTRAHGLDSLLKGGGLEGSLATLGPRLGQVARAAPGLLESPGDTGVRALLVPALLGLALAPLALWLGPARARRGAACALVLALASALLAAGAVAALPETVEWFVSTALDRLLLHAEVFAVLGFLLALGGAEESGPDTAETSRGPGVTQ